MITDTFFHLALTALVIGLGLISAKALYTRFCRKCRAEVEERAAIQAKERKFYRLVLDTVPSPIFVVDESLSLILANQSFAELFRLTPDNMEGKSLELFIADHQLLQKIKVSTQHVFDSGHTEHDSDLYLKNYQTGQWHNYSLDRRIIENGKREVVTVAKDVTTFKSVLEALRVTHNRYSDLVESSSNLILQISNQRVIVYANASVVKYFGVTPHSLIGKDWTDLILPEDREALNRQFSRWSNWATRSEERWECRVVGAFGKVINMMWLVTIIWQDDMFIGVHANGVDITEKKKQEDRLRESNELLEKAYQDLSQKERELISLVKLYEAATSANLHHGPDNSPF